MQVKSIQAISEENCCSEPKLQRNSHDNILYRDLPIFALPTHIHFKKVRFICSHCKKRSLEKRSDNVAEKHLMTRRLVQHIVDQSLRRPFSSVAREVDLDETTVQDVFMGAAEDRLKSRKIPCPVYMGIDDKHLILTVKSSKNEHNEAEKNN